MKPQVVKYQIQTDDLCLSMQKYQLKAIEYGCVRTNTTNPHGEKFSHLYRLNFIAEGHAFYTCCGNRIKIESSTLVFLPPEAILEIQEDGNPVTLFFVNFEVGNITERQNFNHFMAKTIPNFHVHDKDNLLRHLFNNLFDEGNKHDIGHCMCIQGIFYNILVYMIRFSDSYHIHNSESTAPSGSINYFNQAIYYINQNISKNFKVSDIASYVGISEIYLYKIFIKYTQKSPQQFILNYRIQLAKNYLRNPSLSIKTIATELGFSTPNHFSTLFKKSSGISPKEYRQFLNTTSNKVEPNETISKS